MTSDHRDPLHDSRNAMTEWDRSLRPTRERHWAMWVALSAVLLFGFYCGAEWLLGQRAASRPRATSVLPSLPVPSPTTGSVPSPPAPAGQPDRSAVPGTVEVAKCVSATGRATYSDGPCPAGSVGSTVRLRRDLNLADGMSVEAREASNRNNAALATQQLQQLQQSDERQVARHDGAAAARCGHARPAARREAASAGRAIPAGVPLIGSRKLLVPGKAGSEQRSAIPKSGDVPIAPSKHALA